MPDDPDGPPFRVCGSVLRESGRSISGLEKRMPAEARVFLEPVAGGDVADAVAEQSAEIADLLLEGRGVSVGIVALRKQQRVPALRADVFVTAVAIGKLLVVMLAEEARERVPHSCNRTILGEVVAPATAPPFAGVRLFERVVVDVVSP